MFAFKYWAMTVAAFLFFFGTFPVAVSIGYGGNPPAHVARLLEIQMQTFGKVAESALNPLKGLIKTKTEPPD